MPESGRFGPARSVTAPVLEQNKLEHNNCTAEGPPRQAGHEVGVADACTPDRSACPGRLPVAASAVAVIGLAACAPPSSSTSSGTAASGQPIVIGASLPLSGNLAGFGSFQKWGYERAAKEANDTGGITVDGTKRRVELKIVDDKTDPNQVTTNIKTLISNDKAVGLLGSCTPDLVNPGAVVADSAGVPFVAGCDPLEVFTGVKKWTWAWDIFFSVPELAALSVQTIDGLGLATNKKVAILHDTARAGSSSVARSGPTS